jgi:peptidoglycan/xylan/chitin deacetylase (PgdA/CDA1 family)
VSKSLLPSNKVLRQQHISRSTTVKRIAIAVFLLFLALMCSTVSTNAQPTQPRKYIAFRDDDVAPFTSLEPLEAVNQVHIDEGVPVTLGIIPHPRESQEGNELLHDGPFLTYMGSIASNPLFEFAQHGYTHQDIAPSPEGPSEFYGRPYAAQYNSIKQGQADIKEAFGVTPTTFIPPWDSGDSNTTKAAAALGFTDYNTAFSAENVQYSYTNGMRIEGGFTIGAVNDTAFTASIQAAQNETERFLVDPQSGDTLTFAYHAWAFTDSDGAVDGHKIQQLTDFIDFLKTKGVLFTRLDRSTVAGDGGAAGPSQGAGLTVPMAGERIPTPLILVGSVGIVLFGIYGSAQQQNAPRNKRKHK